MRTRRPLVTGTAKLHCERSVTLRGTPMISWQSASPTGQCFRRLLDDARAPLARLRIGVYFVSEGGSVEEAMTLCHTERRG